VPVFEEESGKEISLSNWITSTGIAGDERADSLGEFSVNQPETRVTVKGAGVRMPITISVTPPTWEERCELS